MFQESSLLQIPPQQLTSGCILRGEYVIVLSAQWWQSSSSNENVHFACILSYT